MYRDPPRPPPVGVTVGVNGGDALRPLHMGKLAPVIIIIMCS
jgi:hypothetical protein